MKNGQVFACQFGLDFILAACVLLLSEALRVMCLLERNLSMEGGREGRGEGGREGGREGGKGGKGGRKKNVFMCHHLPLQVEAKIYKIELQGSATKTIQHLSKCNLCDSKRHE